MKRKVFLRVIDFLKLICLPLIFLGCSCVFSQNFPYKPIKLIVPFAPGGGADIVARTISQPMAQLLGQPLVIENKPGGGGTLAADYVAKSTPDGYTLLYTTPGPQMTNPYLMEKLPYNPVTDLTPISQVVFGASVLVINKNLPVNSIKELIAFAKSNPGKISFASSGIGSSSHLAGELFKSRAGVEIFHVPYRGTGLALQDIIGGNVSMAIDSLGAYRSSIDAGSLRVLGVATSKRLGVLPGVPTIAEELPGFEGSPVTYISVRAGTPKAIIDRLNKEVNQTLKIPEVRTQLMSLGLIPQGNTSEEMLQLIRSESLKWQHVIERSGAKAE
ncbi:MAG: tripartite tricarboxylate transporter substrate binding protein [Betaproteobacteria bacterium]|jgi:tripartite-type tricarboxylate transporter receptor subunit TctC